MNKHEYVILMDMDIYNTAISIFKYNEVSHEHINIQKHCTCFYTYINQLIQHVGKAIKTSHQSRFVNNPTRPVASKPPQQHKSRVDWLAVVHSDWSTFFLAGQLDWEKVGQLDWELIVVGRFMVDSRLVMAITGLVRIWQRLILVLHRFDNS